MAPVHTHDCETCIYVGSFSKYRYIRDLETEAMVQHDCYVCPKPINLIVRFGEMGEYGSGLMFLPQSDSLRRAYDLAQASGELDPRIKRELRTWRMGVYSDRLTDMIQFVDTGDDQLIYDFIVSLHDEKKGRS